jgi:hypothetical protein
MDAALVVLPASLGGCARVRGDATETGRELLADSAKLGGWERLAIVVVNGHEDLYEMHGLGRYIVRCTATARAGVGVTAMRAPSNSNSVPAIVA